MENSLESLFPTEFFVKGHELSDAEMDIIIANLNQVISFYPIAQLEESKIIYWLLFALSTAVKSTNTNAAQKLCSLMLKIAHKEPARLVTMLEQIINAPPFEKQSGLYAWADLFYSTTFDFRNYPSMVAMNVVFSHILANTGPVFCIGLTKIIEEGSEKGKSPLLVLTRSLLQSANTPDNLVPTELIAKLLTSYFEQSPNNIGLALTEEITHGVLSGKTSLYILICALKAAVLDNPKAVGMMCDLLNGVNTLVEEEFHKSLYAIIALGPYQGLHSMHILLLSLASASYVDNNSEVISNLIKTIKQFTNEDRKHSALTAIITTGEYRAQNGVMILTRALLAAMAHNLDSSLITAYLSEVIESAPEKLGDAFVQTAPNSKSGNYQNSPLEQLIKKLESPDINSSQQEQLEGIIKKLASSPAAIQLLLALPENTKPLFAQALGTVYFVSPSVINWLINNDNKKLQRLANDTLIPDKFLTIHKLLANEKQFFSHPISTQAVDLTDLNSDPDENMFRN